MKGGLVIDRNKLTLIIALVAVALGAAVALGVFS